jgi:hypothetical protein
MSSSVRDDGDEPTRRSPPWTSERPTSARQEQDRARHLVDEVAAAAAEIQREAQRARRAQAEERWRAEVADQVRAPEEGYRPESNRGLWLPALEPVIMPPPPAEKGGVGLKMAAGFIGAIVVAAGVAFVLMRAVQVPTTGMVASNGSGSRQSDYSSSTPVLSTPVLENLTQITAAEAKVPAAEASPRPSVSLFANTQANAVAVTTPLPADAQAARPLADVPQTARAVEPSRSDPPAARQDQPAPSAPAAEPPRQVEVLSSEEVSSLRKRGQDLLAVGDIASARLILTRLAEAGDADATLMLAGTYDGNVLAGLHVVGIRSDPAKAHEWYTKAAQLGSSEAKLRLTQAARR